MSSPLASSEATARHLALGPDNEQDLFRATIGGLGLTGVIEWVELQLAPIRSAYLDVEILPYDNLDAFWPLAEESVAVSREHTVAWVNCMSRGASAGRRRLYPRPIGCKNGRLDAHSDRTFKKVPFDFPGFALNRLSVGTFNCAYYLALSFEEKEGPTALFNVFLPALTVFLTGTDFMASGA